MSNVGGVYLCEILEEGVWRKLKQLNISGRECDDRQEILYLRMCERGVRMLLLLLRLRQQCI